MESLKLRDVINAIDEEDLKKLSHDLDKGGLHIKQLVKQKIKERESMRIGTCAGCGKEILGEESDFMLHFGAPEFRKKASFCEIDCLEGFLGVLKESRREVLVRNKDE